MIHKFNNPARVAELAPSETLKKIGLSDGMVFCDIGAGTGVFSFPASSYATVYAVEISEQMRDILSGEGESLRVVRDMSAVPDGSCDVAMLCTVLHELGDVPGMAAQIRRVLKENGTLAVIEFHKRQTPIGPPVQHRISDIEAVSVLGDGFALKDSRNMGENFYCLTFSRV